ncbi:zinc finger protein 431-like isoform X1 [Cebidichthys violaceus]|uniref:zinc finger protein 431-like isoform X1 n=1 Tax=Cebidichthys violaceus TaxID=271503 RepID=UPI0035CC824B
MSSPSSSSLLVFKRLSVRLVDCLKTPADSRPAVRPEPGGSSVDPSALALRGLSLRLVDRMKPPGLNGQPVHAAAEQSHVGIKVELKEEVGDYFENPEPDRYADHCGADAGAPINLFKVEVEDSEDPGWGGARTKGTDELQQSRVASEGTLLVFQEDGGGVSDRVTWLIQDYQLSGSLRDATLGDPEERRQEAESQNVSTPEEPEAVEASEPGGGAASERRRLPCEDCGKSFAKRSNLTRHRSHHCGAKRGTTSQAEQEAIAEKPSSLTVRSFSFLSLSTRPMKNKAEKKNQKEAASERRRLPCEDCGRSFSKRSHLTRHQLRHCGATTCTASPLESEPETHSCNECSLTFRTGRHLRLHVRREHRGGREQTEEAPRERRHACEQCDKSFYLLHTLRQHLLTHTGERCHSCEVCGKQFGREGTLKLHQLTHTGEKAFTCEQCGKSCARKGDLKIHMLSHSEERPHGCSRCAKSFKHLAKLKQHERVHTGEKPYQCELCPKRFRVQMSLAAHLYTHSGEKPFKCNMCPKAFSGRNNLKKHKMIHTGEKPYRCSYCAKGCRLLQHLIVHERGHTGERPYTCDACGKGYTNQSALKTHRSTHEERPPSRDIAEPAPPAPETPEKPHRCSQCGKSFTQAVSLKKHWLIHSGEKPYDCKECGKRFNDKSNLAKHARIHTGEKPFKCERCQKGFRLLQHLSSHRLTHDKKR